jgi:hypothetical protein
LLCLEVTLLFNLNYKYINGPYMKLIRLLKHRWSKYISIFWAIWILSSLIYLEKRIIVWISWLQLVLLFQNSLGTWDFTPVSISEDLTHVTQTFTCLLFYFSMNKQHLFIEKYMSIKLKQIYFKIKLNITLFLNISNLKTNWI